MKVLDEKQFDAINAFGLGNSNDAFAQYFSGASFLNPLTNPQETTVFLANITFEPSCRNNWHIHHAKTGGGQLPPAKAGIKKLANRRFLSLREWSLLLDPKSNIGTERKKTAGLPILP